MTVNVCAARSQNNCQQMLGTVQNATETENKRLINKKINKYTKFGKEGKKKKALLLPSEKKTKKPNKTELGGSTATEKQRDHC